MTGRSHAPGPSSPKGTIAWSIAVLMSATACASRGAAPVIVPHSPVVDAQTRLAATLATLFGDVQFEKTPPNTAAATELIVDRSPPLAEIVDVTLKWSRNGYAETLLVALSPERPATGRVLATTLVGDIRRYRRCGNPQISQIGIRSWRGYRR
jgi:D-alanyl-D-alanine carboxypeptidase